MLPSAHHRRCPPPSRPGPGARLPSRTRSPSLRWTSATPSLPACRLQVSAFRFLCPASRLLVDNPFHAPDAFGNAARLGKQRNDALESAMVVEYLTPDQRRVQPVEYIAYAFERHRQRLKRIDAASVLNLADT